MALNDGSCHQLEAEEQGGAVGYIFGGFGTLTPDFAPNGQAITQLFWVASQDFIIAAGPGYQQDTFNFIAIDGIPYLYTADASFTENTGNWTWTNIGDAPFVDGITYEVCFDTALPLVPTAGVSLNSLWNQYLALKGLGGRSSVNGKKFALFAKEILEQTGIDVIGSHLDSVEVLWLRIAIKNWVDSESWVDAEEWID